MTRRHVLRLFGAGSAVVVLSAGQQALAPTSAFAATDATPPRGPATATNANSRAVVDVYGGQTSDGAQIIQWSSSGSDNQKWVFTLAADGWATITSRSSGKVLDLLGGATANGTRVVQWTASGAASQQWRIEAADGGYATIRNRASGTLLTVADNSTWNGAWIVVSADTGHASQRWELQGPPGSEVPFTLDTSNRENRTDDPIPNAGGVAGGVAYGVTRNGFSRDGKPWFPVSGEFHYVRSPEATWERELGKLRAAGVTIVATYVFWSQHETSEGTWDFSGRRNLRAFVQAAQRQGLQLWLRPGPYINAETTNGGIPSFALNGSRSNDAGYLAKADVYLAKIAEQLSGLWAKDGGPIVGIQLENEFASGDAAHITRLRQMCESHGLLAPFYTVTANSHFEKNTAIPLQGSYSYRGWESQGGTGAVSGYVFGTDEWTANTDIGGTYYNTLDYPRGYCELGTGSPMRGNTRFRVEAKYVVGQAYDSVGRGSNYLGYYMFHGGTQIPGQSDSWPLTYDFQAPIGEFGQTRESYAQYRRLHTFLQTSADELVKTRFSRDPGQVLDPTVTWRPRFIGRFDGAGRGFIFVNNTQRNVAMVPQTGLQIRITTPTETIPFPEAPLTMPVDRYNFFPFKTDLNGVDLRWATVEPLAKLDGGDLPTWVYWAPDWTSRTLAFGSTVVVDDETGTTGRDVVGSELLVRLPGGQRSSLIVRGSSGLPAARIVVLTEQESLNAAVVDVDGRARLVVASGGKLAGVKPTLRFAGPAGGTVSVEMLPTAGLRPPSGWAPVSTSGLFAQYRVDLPAAGAAPTITPESGNRWRITSDPASLAGLAAARIVLDYRGGSAFLIGAGTTITNDFYHGERWTVDLNRLDAGARADLVVQIDGWDNGISGVDKPAGAMPALPGWDWQPIREAEWAAGVLEPAVATKCVAGKVYVSVAVRNAGDRAIDIEVQTPIGSKSFAAVQPGKSASAAFNSRVAALATGQITVVGKAAGAVLHSSAHSYEATTCS
ncbi:beta-galactosidase [Arthrobacter sp. 35W]|uniref:beta-galactosidase n=1 Tax=Arthrobacter sp. 35W TaxID=1132441 RepID=UPI00041573D9|nr:beta-galactosidase [Arthrobacter sp. 35W]